MLGNHNAYLDFSVATHCINFCPCNFVVAIDDFIGREEIEKGAYTTGKLKCKVESLPNAKRFIDIGEGYFIHDMNGFRCEINDKTKSDTTDIVQSPDETYAVHVEYRYLFKHGDCIDLNTINDTWYVYPEGKFNVTKISLATEELYLYNKKFKGLPIKKVSHNFRFFNHFYKKLSSIPWRIHSFCLLRNTTPHGNK